MWTKTAHGTWKKHEDIQKSIQKVHVENADQKLEVEVKKGQMAAEQRKIDMEVLNEKHEVKKFKMINQIELLELVNRERVFNKFRFDCHQIATQYDEFLKLFHRNMEEMTRIFDKIKKDRVQFTKPIQLIEAANIIQSVCNSLQELKIISDPLISMDFQEMRIKILRKCFEMERIIKEIVCFIEIHREDFRTVMARTMVLKKVYSDRLEEIEGPYGELKKLVTGMKVMIQQLEIPPSNRLEGSEIRQLRSLEATPITNGSGKHMAIVDGPQRK